MLFLHNQLGALAILACNELGAHSAILACNGALGAHSAILALC